MYTLNEIPSFIQIEGGKVALNGDDLTQAGTINAVLTATASVSGISIQLPFSVVELNCTPLELVATPSTLTLT